MHVTADVFGCEDSDPTALARDAALAKSGRDIFGIEEDSAASVALGAGALAEIRANVKAAVAALARAQDGMYPTDREWPESGTSLHKRARSFSVGDSVLEKGSMRSGTVTEVSASNEVIHVQWGPSLSGMYLAKNLELTAE